MRNRKEYLMRQIPVGATGSSVLVVKPDHLASRSKDASLPPVLSTPVMLLVMENAALSAVKPYLDRGEAAVGTRIDVRHLSPSYAGARVVGEARIIRVEGRRLEFRVTALDESGQIGAGTHERFVIKVAQMKRCVAAKRLARAHLHRLAGEAS
jgi:fluoroacetyl-CoA thioesterase